MPLPTFTAGSTARAQDVTDAFALCVLTDTSRTISVTHTWSASQTFSGGWSAAAACAITVASATAFTVGRQGATDPALLVHSSTASQATGVQITGKAAASGAAIAAISSGTNENLTIDAKGSGTVTIGGTSTGGITLARATTVSAGDLTVSVGNILLGAGYVSHMRIDEQTSTSGSIAFASIPAGYRALRVVLVGRQDKAATRGEVRIRFNGDSGNNYDTQYLQGINGGSAVATPDVAASSSFVGELPAANAVANQSGMIVFDIPYYAATTFQKQLITQSCYKRANASTDMVQFMTANFWRSTAAISSLTIYADGPGTSNFVTGTTAVLYGLL